MRAHTLASPTRVRILRYGDEGIEEAELAEPWTLSPPASSAKGVLWIDIVGLGNASGLEQLGRQFGLHRLTLEDVANTHQRPKIEHFESYLYVVLRVPVPGADLHLSQLSLIIADNFLLSFEEGEGPLLDPVRQRIRERAGVIATSGSDYLAYAIVDAAIDHYFPILDQYSDRLDAVERVVLQDATTRVLPELYSIKEALRECRRSVAPVRDLLGTLMREDLPIGKPETRLHWRDCHDHVHQLMEIVESDRDTATSLMELHVSSVGNRMNEVMKVLTIIATLFIPLSFIASLYGMNFDTKASPWNMPELGWRFGYPLTLLLMLSVTSGMLMFFRRRGWFGRLELRPPGATDAERDP